MKRKKRKINKNFIWYDPRKYCTNKSQKSVIEKFINDVYVGLGLKNPHSNTEKKKMALNVIISNVIESCSTGKFIAVPHYRGYYTNKTANKIIYNTYEFIVGGVKALVKADYLELKPGYYNYLAPEKNTVSGIKAKKKLIDKVNSYMQIDPAAINYFDVTEGVTYIFNEDDFAKIEFDNVVELKDKKKKPIAYRPNRISELSKNFLREYNSFIKNFDIKIPFDKIRKNKYPLFNIHTYITETTNTQQEYTINITIPLIGCSVVNSIIYKELQCQLKRTFNNCRFDQGGRFYGADYQFLSKEERSWIRINGNPVVEIDFKCFHPRMLYHELGIDIKGDLYEMVHSDRQLRPAIKKMLNIMINCNGDYNAVEAFKDYLEKEEKGAEIHNIMLKHRIDEWKLISMIKRAHQPLNQFFGSNIGREKQYKDSIIAMRIMKHFMKMKAACLCIHDSFLVEEIYTDELYELLITEYKKMCGFNPELEIIRKEQKI